MKERGKVGFDIWFDCLEDTNCHQAKGGKGNSTVDLRVEEEKNYQFNHLSFDVYNNHAGKTAKEQSPVQKSRVNESSESTCRR